MKFILIINVSLQSNYFSLIVCFFKRFTFKDLLLDIICLCYGQFYFFYLQMKVHGRNGPKVKKFTELSSQACRIYSFERMTDVVFVHNALHVQPYDFMVGRIQNRITLALL